MPINDVVAQLADDLVPQPKIQTLRLGIERGDAHEDIRGFAKNALLGKLDQPRANALAPRAGRHTNGLNVAHERALHAQHDEAGKAAISKCHVALSVATGE